MDGLRYRSSTSEGTISREGIREVADDKHNVYLSLGRAAATIVPERYFAPRQAVEGCLETARAYQRDPLLRWETATETRFRAYPCIAASRTRSDQHLVIAAHSH